MTTTKWDIGPRRNGKTARLIERASAENLYIVVHDRNRAMGIARQAREMGCDILFPITLSELPIKTRGNPYAMTHPGVLADDVDAILAKIVGMPVIGAASCGELEYWLPVPPKACQPLANRVEAGSLQPLIENPGGAIRRGIF